MTRDEFLEHFKDILQTESDIAFDMNLENIEEWDSLAKMATVAFFDSKFGIKMVFNDFKDIKTVEDIALKAGL